MWSEAAKNLRKKTKNRNRRLATARKIVGTDERKGIACFRACFAVVILFGLDRSSTIVVCSRFFVVVFVCCGVLLECATRRRIGAGDRAIRCDCRVVVFKHRDHISVLLFTSSLFPLGLLVYIWVSVSVSLSRARSSWLLGIFVPLSWHNKRTHTHTHCRVQSAA